MVTYLKVVIELPSIFGIQINKEASYKHVDFNLICTTDVFNMKCAVLETHKDE